MNLRLKRILIFSAFLTLCTACSATELKLSALSDWHNADLQQSWKAWQNSCIAFKKKKMQNWIQLCEKSKQVATINKDIKTFFESNFKVAPITNKDGSTEGIITGYYEPVLQGSLQASNEFKYPIYTKPTDRTVQSLTRQQIENHPDKLENDIILWTNDPYDLFFLHVQGSGRVQLKNGQQKSLVYAGNNNRAYTSIGKVLINSGEMLREKVSLQTLKTWLNNNPSKSTNVLQQNERYIFFNLTETPKEETGPRGSLNIPLTPSHSIAIDPNYVTMGSPVWLETTLPTDNNEPKNFYRLVFAQDTGAAIKGQVRADVFFGQGEEAEFLAGNMNQKGKMYQLVPQ